MRTLIPALCSIAVLIAAGCATGTGDRTGYSSADQRDRSASVGATREPIPDSSNNGKLDFQEAGTQLAGSPGTVGSLGNPGAGGQPPGGSGF